MDWEELAPCPLATSHAGAFVYNDRIYSLGTGVTGGANSRRVFEYDPVGDSWTEKTAAPGDLYSSASTMIGDQIYAVIEGSTPMALRIYDIGSDSWSATSNSPAANSTNQMIWTDGSIIYMSDGWGGDSGIHTYNGSSWSADVTSWSPHKPYIPAVATIGTATYFFGRYDSGNMMDDSIKFAAPATWSTLATAPTRLAQSGTAVNGTTIYVVGGYTDGFANQPNVYAYDTLLDSWTNLGAGPTANMAGVSAAYIDPYLYVWGGGDLWRTTVDGGPVDPPDEDPDPEPDTDYRPQAGSFIQVRGL